MESQNQSLPTIDFSAWTSTSSPARRLEVARELVEACRRTGFVYLTNHGVDPLLVKDAFVWSKQFFELSLEEKTQAERDRSTAIFRGYNAPGLQRVPLTLRVRGGDPDITGFSPDYNETFDMGSDENIDQPNRWLPEHHLPGFRRFSTAFQQECWKTVQNVLRALTIGLGINDEGAIERLHTYHNNSLSFKHYPSVPTSEFQSHEKERLGSHSDLTSVTLLFQDNCGGLEVEQQGKRGEFFPVSPINDTLVLNIGDVLMRWSNGQIVDLPSDSLLSAVHRVQPPTADHNAHDNKMTRERFSIVYFVLPTDETTIECLPGCFDDKNPAKYPPRSLKELRADYSRLFYPGGKV